ncbi:MAG: helicase-exonuclease AddAB subunit AddA [Planctomycetales bacterium]|nr:helicase-exonuclease AddAB subunit AddA [Planctomycetales bacterium]
MTRQPKQTKWTKAQRAAIEAVGREVLVTASAGTGKTAVLSQRAVARVADPNDPARADTMLVLTFTDAAAEEMRSRIAQKLYETWQETRDSRLREELLRLDRAYISTIHSFCKRILTEFFYLTDLDPAFGIINADEQQLLKAETLIEALEEAWADETLAEGLRVLFDGRKIQPGRNSFIDRIIPLSEFLDSVVSREEFYTRAAAMNDMQNEAYLHLQSAQKGMLLDKLAQCRRRLEYAIALDAQFCGGQYVTDYIRGQILPAVISCAEFLKKDNFAVCRERLRDFEFSRMPAFKKNQWPESVKDRISDPVVAVREELMGLGDFALLCGGYDERLAPQVAVQTMTLVELLRRFDGRYAAVKRQRNVLDFADLEHRAMALLETHPEVSDKLKERFAHIFIDEYQDINAVQQRILERLSRPDNVFVVGDVKQSIYGFRQSSPAIFLSRLKTAADIAEPSDKPGRVDLQDNFRCRQKIIECVNALFVRVMTQAVADMDYDARAALTPKFPYEPFEAADGPAEPVELYLLDEDSGGRENTDSGGNAGITQPVSAAQRQAAFIARRIQKMVGVETGTPEFNIYDNKTERYRPVEYRDIVILMRSLRFKAQEYIEILRLAGVPVGSQSACGYFEAVEIADTLCLLKVLDNPDRDIELAALLRSPIFGVSDTELAQIRLNADRKAGFYPAVRKYAQDGPNPDLRSNLAGILAQINGWRVQARQGSLADLLDKIFRQKALAAFYSALPNGAQRQANLRKLHDHAIQFEHFRTTDPGTALVRFVEFLEKLAEAEQDWAPAEPDNSSENAVRIISVHKAKGLEFGVVFVAELNTQFNTQDTAGECLIDEQTVGLQMPDRAAAARFPSMAHQVIAERKRRASLAEEMRILYVALTRAREKLILTACRKSDACKKSLTEWAAFSARLPDWKLAEARCPLDWVLAGFADQRRLAAMFEVENESLRDDALFFAQRIGIERLNEMTSRILVSKRSLKSVTQLPQAGSDADCRAAAAFETIRQNLSWRYAFADVTPLPAKVSVSQLTHRDDEFAAGDWSRAFGRKPSASGGLPEPPQTPDALAFGSAVHRIFERIDLSKPVDAAAVESVIKKLVETRVLDAALAQAIDPRAILEFFESSLGKLAMAAGAAVRREWPFTYALDAAAVGAESRGEFVVLQGIVDMIIPTNAGLVIVDFKTDRTDGNALRERGEHHAPQLRLYARAAGEILKRPVVSAWLYFPAAAKAVQVEL